MPLISLSFLDVYGPHCCCTAQGANEITTTLLSAYSLTKLRLRKWQKGNYQTISAVGDTLDEI
jgi:hypothetical protein